MAFIFRYFLNAIQLLKVGQRLIGFAHFMFVLSLFCFGAYCAITICCAPFDLYQVRRGCRMTTWPPMLGMASTMLVVAGSRAFGLKAFSASLQFFVRSFIMSVIRHTAAAAFCVVLSSAVWAADPVDHKAHHPEATASSTSAKAAPAGDTAKKSMADMDAQMKVMREMHEKMMNAKTPEERQALGAEHMKAMKDGMAMMGGMSSMAMMGGAGKGGMKGGMKGDMPGDMMMCHQMMEKRMAMMEGMMQMMMDHMMVLDSK